ncbi:MAG: hypothetical protein JWN93_2326 [Hyphomicrobiales bacterium]|nr:hypothetical protein [Hyphomicrobiales bacterium]
MSSAALSSHTPRKSNVRMSVGSLRRAAEAAGYGAAYAWDDQPAVAWRVGAAQVASAAVFVMASGVALAWLAF